MQMVPAAADLWGAAAGSVVLRTLAWLDAHSVLLVATPQPEQSAPPAPGRAPGRGQPAHPGPALRCSVGGCAPGPHFVCRLVAGSLTAACSHSSHLILTPLFLMKFPILQAQLEVHRTALRGRSVPWGRRPIDPVICCREVHGQSCSTVPSAFCTTRGRFAGTGRRRAAAEGAGGAVRPGGHGGGAGGGAGERRRAVLVARRRPLPGAVQLLSPSPVSPWRTPRPRRFQVRLRPPLPLSAAATHELWCRVLLARDAQLVQKTVLQTQQTRSEGVGWTLQVVLKMICWHLFVTWFWVDMAIAA